MSQEKRLKKNYLASNHIEIYKPIDKRASLEGLYESERHTIKLLFGKFNSVLDIGCNVGNLCNVFFDNCDDVTYTGVDLDKNALEVGKKNNPKANFIHADVLDKREAKTIPNVDLVLALNVVDQYEDWKRILKVICGFSNKYVNFSTLLRLSGPTVVDEDLSYTCYNNRVLWAIHNVFSLIAYCATEHINACKMYVYCYKKPLKCTVHPIHPKDLYVGNVILEINKDKAWFCSGEPPEVQIWAGGNLYYTSTKKTLLW